VTTARKLHFYGNRTLENTRALSVSNIFFARYFFGVATGRVIFYFCATRSSKVMVAFPEIEFVTQAWNCMFTVGINKIKLCRFLALEQIAVERLFFETFQFVLV
jgi:hypothetical protein